MNQTNEENVVEFIHDLQAHANEQYEIVKTVRQLVLEQNAALNESMKYGGIVYQKNNELLMGIFSYKNHVSLELGRGFELDDTYAVLEGNGKYRRHIKLHNIAEVEQKYAQFYIQAAIT